MNKYKSTGNRGLFDEQENVAKLAIIGSPLEMISEKKVKAMTYGTTSLKGQNMYLDLWNKA